MRPAPVETLLRRTNGTKTPKSLLSCFRTVRHFAEALDDDDDCGEMARRSLNITNPNPIPIPNPDPNPNQESATATYMAERAAKAAAALQQAQP